MTWNKILLFSTSNFDLYFDGYKSSENVFRNGKYWHSYKWPNSIQLSFFGWFPICVVYRASDMSLNVTIDGQIVSMLTENQSQNIFNELSNDDILLGGESLFSGHITDFNIWSRPLLSEDVENYNNDCKGNVDGTLDPDIVSWSNIKIIDQTENIKLILLQRNIICEGQQRNETYQLIFPPVMTPYDVAVKECKKMNVEMIILQNKPDWLKILFQSQEIKMNSMCQDRIWMQSKKNPSNSLGIKIESQNVTQNSFKLTENKKVCKQLDLRTNQHNEADCNEYLCYACEFPSKKLIFTLKGLCSEQQAIDTQYFLDQENVLPEKIVLSGVNGLTQIVQNHFSSEWKIISLTAQNGSLKEIGINNDTRIFLPVGVQTWYFSYNCFREVNMFPIKLKLSNVS